ncbi:MAG: electron transfer flavoprotein subunit alpha [Rickettsiaceae bacterium]|nr:electron transfer flavoprotein subunit alpha [Rickettsiaceae bacterium]
MTILLIAEHDNTTLRASTLCTANAAAKIGGEIHILVAGKNCAAVATEASKINGIAKVIKVDDAAYEHALAENLANLIISMAGSYSHILAPSNTFGKNFMPRVAALLDVAQITDAIEVISPDTFKRPIYAGNAIATVQSSDKIKIITVRTTAFEKAATTGSASTEDASAKGDSGLSSFVKLEGSGSSCCVKSPQKSTIAPSAPPAQQLTLALSPMISRWGRQAKSWLPSFISPLVFPEQSSIWQV